jgi:hypothetical protein
MRSHPAACLFGSSRKHAFDLITVIGREPGAECEHIAYEIGEYRFVRMPGSAYEMNAYGKSAFWNNSHGFVAKVGRLANGDTSAFKRICTDADASPLAIADALPLAIKDKVLKAEKMKRRWEITDEQVASHVNSVVAFKEIFDRTRLVIFSGLQDAVFARSERLYREAIQKNYPKIRMFSTSFFFGNNMTKIYEDLDRDSQVAQLIREVSGTFQGHLASVDLKPAA